MSPINAKAQSSDFRLRRDIHVHVHVYNMYMYIRGVYRPFSTTAEPWSAPHAREVGNADGGIFQAQVGAACCSGALRQGASGTSTIQRAMQRPRAARSTNRHHAHRPGDGENSIEQLVAVPTSEGTPRASNTIRGGARTAAIMGDGSSSASPQAASPLPQVAPSPPPEKPWTVSVLQERLKQMLMRGGGRRWPSGGAALLPKASVGLVMEAAVVVTDFDVQRSVVQDACGSRLDAREALALLICDVLLGALIPDEDARRLGDIMGKWVYGKAATLLKEENDLARAAGKRAGKLSSLNPEFEQKKAALDARERDELSAFRQRPISLRLPSAEECAAAERERTRPPPPPPKADPLEAWCQRHKPPGGVDAVRHRQHKARLIDALDARKNRYPVGWREHEEQARRQEEARKRRRPNSLCACDDAIPSWLCRVALCYAKEVGACDDYSCSQTCHCMSGAWSDECLEPQQRRLSEGSILQRREENRYYDDGSPCILPRCVEPKPGGEFGEGFNLKWAAKRLTQEDMRLWDEDAYPAVPFEEYPSFGRL